MGFGRTCANTSSSLAFRTIRTAAPMKIGTSAFPSDCSTAARPENERSADWLPIPLFQSAALRSFSSEAMFQPREYSRPTWQSMLFFHFQHASLILHDASRTGTSQALLSAPPLSRPASEMTLSTPLTLASLLFCTCPHHPSSAHSRSGRD